MKEKSRFIIQVGFAIIFSVIVGVLLLVLVYALPTERIRRNVATSAEQISSEGSYFQWAKGYKNAQSDSYSDASLYLNAMYPGSGNILQDALNVPRLLYGDDNNEESAVLLANGDTGETHIENYGRYWHGSLIILKPLLLLFDVTDIRMFSMILQMGLLFLVIIGMMKRELLNAIPALFAALAVLNPVTMVMCFVFSIEYTLLLLMMIIMLFYFDELQKGRRMEFFFLISGILFVYFGELSFPMVGFAFPMILWLLMTQADVKQKVQKEFLYGILWAAGYVCVWVGKWIVAWIFTGFNYFSEAVGQAERYVSDHATWETENPSVWARIGRNINVYMKWPFFFLAIGILIILIIYLCKMRGQLKKDNLKEMMPFFLLVLFPVAIWIVLGNGYSYVHYWFTHKLFSISVFAGCCMVLSLVRKETIRG